MQIPVLGLGDLNQEVIRRLGSMLNSDFKKIRIYTGGISKFPENSFNNLRDQYMAERILDGFREDGIQIIVTDKDIYSKGKTYVFGESEYRGPAVVSTKRLNPIFYNKDNDNDLMLRRLKKESVHHLGRCFGMENCNNPGCVMQRPSSTVDLDEKNDGFCEECQITISTKGLPLK